MGKLNVNFNLIKVRNNSYLYISIHHNRKRIRKKLHVVFQASDWDKKKQRLDASSSNNRTVNNYLAQLTNDIYEFYNSHLLRNEAVDLTNFVEYIDDLISPKAQNKEKTFLAFFLEFISDSSEGKRLTPNGRRIKKSTIQSYHSCYNHLVKFQTSTGYKLKFENIDKIFFSEFTSYCSSLSILNGSAGKLVKIIKTFLHYAKEQSWNSYDKFVKGLRVFPSDPNHIALTEDELNKIEVTDNLPNTLLFAKDLFLLQCFTGVRVGDLLSIESSNINIQEQLLIITTHKTEHNLVIPLSHKSIAILQKYNFEIPKINVQLYNKHIKRIAELAGIHEAVKTVRYSGNRRIEKLMPKFQMLTSHTARRTFITLMLKRGVLPELVMKVSGHRSRKSFDKYVRITQVESVNSIRNILDSM